MHNHNKWEAWWDGLPVHTKKYLEHQPIWKHNEMIGAMLGAFAVGVLIGLCF